MTTTREQDSTRIRLHRPMKKYCITFALVLIIGLSLLAIPVEAAQKKSQKKVSKTHYRKTSSKRKKSIKAPIVSLPPVLDTTCIDTLTALQQGITTEINRWSYVRYKHGGISLRGVDCSGFTYKVFRNSLNYTLPRTSREQAKVGEEVDKDSLTFGDLLFFYSRARAKRKRINHVGIYIGDGNFVHSRRRHGVGIDSLEESYYAKHFAVAKRVIPLAVDASGEAQNEE